MLTKKLALASAVLLTSAQMAYADDLQINGFINVTAGIVDDKTVGETDVGQGYDTGVSFDQGTLAGLQVSKRINDKTSATVQMVARGKTGYETDATWAYVSYDLTDNSTIKAGRLRTPFFQYSDFLEVGYAYNWVTPPSIVYRLDTMSSVTGVDFTQRFTAGAVDGAVQVYAGRYHDDFNLDGDTYDMELRKAGGIVLSGNVGDFGARLSYHQAGFYINGLENVFDTSTNSIPTDARKLDQLYTMAVLNGVDVRPEGQTSRFYQGALSWDNGTASIVAEYTALRHESHLLLDDDAWFISGAYRLGSFTPHLTYARSDDAKKSGATGVAQSFSEDKQSSITLGVRYDFAPSTALKVEATYVEREEAESRRAALGAGTAAVTASKIKLDKTDGMLYTLGLSVMF